MGRINDARLYLLDKTEMCMLRFLTKKPARRNKMKTVNPKHIEQLLTLINASPYFKLLNIEVCELKKGYSKIIVRLEEKHLNPFGTLHGGVYASAIDTAAYWAAYCELCNARSFQ